MATSPAAHGSGASFAGPLYDAAMTGSDVLDRLLEVYGSVSLSRISLTSFAETPLHLAALLGHLEFTKRLLKLRPELASEQDSEKCTPLHLAAANGRVQVVRELLGANENACLVQDQDGRVPLHLAAMRGRCEAVLELLKSTQAQKSLKMKVDDGDGILHLCVKYKHLDVLKAVLASTGDDDGEVLKMTDSHGNTVLHLAVMLKQKKTVRFLVGLPTVKTEMMNTTNDRGHTALNVLKHSPKDYKSREIREILIGARVKTVPQGGWRTWVCRLVKLVRDYKGDWMEETRGSLMMVATIIATVTFTAGMAPPGGVWQQDTDKSIYPNACSNTSVCYAGTAVLAYYDPVDYLKFMEYNMTSFVSSLAVILLLISGFPLNNKFCLWLLSLVMCVTIIFLGLAFLKALALMFPERRSGIPIMLKEFAIYIKVILEVWLVMTCIVGLWLLIRLSYWLVHIYNSYLKSAWRKLLGFRPSVSKELPRQENPLSCWKLRWSQI